MVNNQITLNLQLACNNLKGLPPQKKIKSWINSIFSIYKKKIELTIRIVDVKEMHYLNAYYSGKNFPTNVLSFPFEPPAKIKSSVLGDIVICKQIITHEAKQKNVHAHTHWAHMIIHGSLHLLGYTHNCASEAKLMKRIEINMMQQFGYNICCYPIK